MAAVLPQTNELHPFLQRHLVFIGMNKVDQMYRLSSLTTKYILSARSMCFYVCSVYFRFEVKSIVKWMHVCPWLHGEMECSYWNAKGIRNSFSQQRISKYELFYFLDKDAHFTQHSIHWCYLCLQFYEFEAATSARKATENLGSLITIALPIQHDVIIFTLVNT